VISLQENWIKISDYIYEGRDLTIETVGPDVTGTKYNKSSVRPRTKITPLSENANTVKMWLSEQPEILTLYKKYDYDEMKNILLTWLNPETEETTEETIEIEMIYHPVSDCEEITPMYLEGGSVFETMCIYNCNAADLFIKRCEELGLTKGKHENEKGLTYWLTHKDNYRFAKLGGSYCTSDTESAQFKAHRKGTYVELKTVHNTNIKHVDAIINRFIAKQNEELLNSETLGSVLTTMYGIKSRLSGIDANAKTRSSYNALCNFIQEEITKLEKISIKK
jgi:hypothetical protein